MPDSCVFSVGGACCASTGNFVIPPEDKLQNQDQEYGLNVQVDCEVWETVDTEPTCT